MDSTPFTFWLWLLQFFLFGFLFLLLFLLILRFRVFLALRTRPALLAAAVRGARRVRLYEGSERRSEGERWARNKTVVENGRLQLLIQIRGT